MPTESEKILVETDTSTVGIGGCLSVIRDGVEEYKDKEGANAYLVSRL